MFHPLCVSQRGQPGKASLWSGIFSEEIWRNTAVQMLGLEPQSSHRLGQEFYHWARPAYRLALAQLSTHSRLTPPVCDKEYERVSGGSFPRAPCLCPSAGLWSWFSYLQTVAHSKCSLLSLCNLYVVIKIWQRWIFPDAEPGIGALQNPASEKAGTWNTGYRDSRSR